MIRDWEQKLSLVAEIIEEWKNTQSKWLHLEGIFVGGDARDTLATVAKKFDEIDVVYREVRSCIYMNDDDDDYDDILHYYIHFFLGFPSE